MLVNGDKSDKQGGASANGNGNGNGGRRGAKGKWDPERSLETARAMARRGCTQKQIAHALGYSETYFYEVIRKRPELADALKEGKIVADTQVESSLYRRAMGYSYEETKEVLELDATTRKTRSIRRETITKTVLPDVTAQIFWLKNRDPEAWRDLSRREHTGKDGGPIEHRDVSQYSDEELTAIANGDKPR